MRHGHSVIECQWQCEPLSLSHAVLHGHSVQLTLWLPQRLRHCDCQRLHYGLTILESLRVHHGVSLCLLVRQCLGYSHVLLHGHGDADGERQRVPNSGAELAQVLQQGEWGWRG